MKKKLALEAHSVFGVIHLVLGWVFAELEVDGS